jgi:hypothetical protein
VTFDDQDEVRSECPDRVEVRILRAAHSGYTDERLTGMDAVPSHPDERLPQPQRHQGLGYGGTEGDDPHRVILPDPSGRVLRVPGATLPYPARLTPGDTAVLGEPIDFGAGGVKLQLVRRERRVPGPERRGRDAAVAELY